MSVGDFIVQVRRTSSHGTAVDHVARLNARRHQSRTPDTHAHAHAHTHITTTTTTTITTTTTTTTTTATAITTNLHKSMLQPKRIARHRNPIAVHDAHPYMLTSTHLKVLLKALLIRVRAVRRRVGELVH
jgi:hypothetical protein